VLGLAWGLM